ncbi:dienelactone hydrolase family protein [Microscilla marina]|uniref:Dienelactone hydrolase family protein n=1 Tax=Microscilla marina ATCC 23134 TaxID=313606 RepID=A1ZHS8_MICM2|nr:dienelactone hydrolase family protein [Microscilla marina]EAY30085.1 dienelactone hydrolase family protein [Microscilla marina ATCC 23134]
MIKTETITYHDAQGNAFEGTINWDDATQQKRPGILVVHTFKGQGEFDNQKAVALASMGYVGFAIDLYGKGRRASVKEEAQALMDELNNDRPLLLQRMELALDVLKKHALTDTGQLGAVGFCFGGKAVLDLARSGAHLQGVVSFHGVYDAPVMSHPTPIKAAVLVLHGWEDPLATPEQTVALAHELTERKADWQILAFGHTGHAFTNPSANQPGMFYQPDTDRRAWQAMKQLFEEKFH